MAAPLRLSRHTTLTFRSLHQPPPNVFHQPTALLLCLPPSSRAFHASPAPQMIETLLLSTHTLLTSIHTATHLPWALTIPLSALLLRLSITLPLTLLSHRAAQTRAALQPLLQAWTHQLRRQTMATSKHLGPVVVHRDAEAAVRQTRAQIYARWGCAPWRNFLPAAQLPVWLLMIETLRGMAGTRKGLLGLVLPDGPAGTVIDELSAAPEMAAVGIPEADLGGELVGERSVVEDLAVPVEPSMATEGMLWFPDLMVPDPLLVLPFLLSATMFLNIYAGRRKGIPGVEMSRGRTRLMRALGVVALVAGPLTLQVPSAILLYWVSSGLWAFGQSWIIEHYLPIRPPVKLCKPIQDGTQTTS